MAVEIPHSETLKGPKKRKFDHRKGSKIKNNRKMNQGAKITVKKNRKMRKLIQRRVKEYNSDDDDPTLGVGDPSVSPLDHEEASTRTSSEDDADDHLVTVGEKGSSDDEGDGILQGVTKFAEGCRAFRMAFMKIMKKNISNDGLGPVLSGHKKLIAEKLAEEESERKVKGQAKKEKHMVGEKGHVKPASFLDTNEKFLVSIATKGVVKLFNAVNKAQNAQKGLNPSRSKDAKVLGKRRKEAFLAELRKKSSRGTENPSTINNTERTKLAHSENNDEPGWAPLRDSYMLTDSKLKNWDKMQDPAVTLAPDVMPLGSSSDDE
eukprot:TRINITY_DN1420_c0_g1_i1.p1 TRINITY_DN1420_c0_g1~~TRINITY_DN1420_c0_g1_i1.p1  ORF type:complete len:320 (-),score=81.90 TRINITY_DN1420_c0_g1_i1:577-1536(-)